MTIGDPEVLCLGREARLIDAPIVDGAPSVAHLADRVAAALEAVLPGTPINRKPVSARDAGALSEGYDALGRAAGRRHAGAT